MRCGLPVELLGSGLQVTFSRGADPHCVTDMFGDPGNKKRERSPSLPGAHRAQGTLVPGK